MAQQYANFLFKLLKLIILFQEKTHILQEFNALLDLVQCL